MANSGQTLDAPISKSRTLMTSRIRLLQMCITAAFCLCHRRAFAFAPHVHFQKVPSRSNAFRWVSADNNQRQHAAPLTLSATASVREAINLLKAEPLESLLPQQDLLTIIDELLSDDALMEDSESLIVKTWDKLEGKLQGETRSLSQILGEETTNQILNSVENVEGYDPASVQAFLESEAITKLLAQILYDGIYNFFQTIDVFGNIIGNLPIIGPIRNQIRDEAKRNLDRTVGPLIQTFLRSYTKVAVVEASQFILSPSNRKIFGSANRKLFSNILERPINSLLPPKTMSLQLREDGLQVLRSLKKEDLEEYVKWGYDILGDKAVDDVLNVNRVVDASPMLEQTLDRIWTKATTANSSGSAE